MVRLRVPSQSLSSRDQHSPHPSPDLVFSAAVSTVDLDIGGVQGHVHLDVPQTSASSLPLTRSAVTSSLPSASESGTLARVPV